MCGICGIHYLERAQLIRAQTEQVETTLDSARPYGRGMWGLLCLELWMRIFLDDPVQPC